MKKTRAQIGAQSKPQPKSEPRPGSGSPTRQHLGSDRPFPDTIGTTSDKPDRDQLFSATPRAHHLFDDMPTRPRSIFLGHFSDTTWSRSTMPEQHRRTPGARRNVTRTSRHQRPICSATPCPTRVRPLQCPRPSRFRANVRADTEPLQYPVSEPMNSVRADEQYPT